MFKSTKIAPPFVRGISIVSVCSLIVCLFISCANNVSIWGTDKYEVAYDTEIFSIVSNTETTLELRLEEETQVADIAINAVHPFTFNDEDGVDMYIDSAVKAFEQNYSRISNKSEDIQTQKGVTVKTISISGDTEEYEGVSLGMMKLMVSDKTLMHIEIVGNAKIIKKNMDSVLNLLESAKLEE